MLNLIMWWMMGCGDKALDNPQEKSACDPLDEGLCAFPFPSSFYMTEDSASRTGWKLDFQTASLPVNYNGIEANPALWNERDGFSPLTPIMTYFPNLSSQGLMSQLQLADYLSDTVSTIVIDVETGERIPHFAELDMSHDQDDRRALLLHPVQQIPWGHRIVVGMRNLKDTQGNLVSSSEAFAALRDDAITDDFDIEYRREHYNTVIFPALQAEGFQREDLQIAWDFVVASREGVTGKLLSMRDDLLNRLPEGGPQYEIDEVENFTVEENPHVAKRIYGTMTVPFYTEVEGKNTLLSRDENGMPMYMGDTKREFTIVVPRSLWENGESGPILQYGHGLMGKQSEVESGYLGEMANRDGYVLLAVDWSGMSIRDLDAIMLMMVNEIDHFSIVPERTQQGIIEVLAAGEMLSGDLAQDPELQSPVSNQSIVDTSTKYFYGNSQGGILGTVYTAISPDIERAVLGVCGGPFSLLLPRSSDFASYFTLLKTMYPDYMEISLWLGMMQTVWDSAEPSGYLDAIAKEPFAGNPSKNVLIQVGIGDAQVNTLGAHVQMRSIGGGLVSEPVREIWGLEELPNGYIGSGLVEWDYGIEEPFESVPPTEDNSVHGAVRQELLGQMQLHHFLSTGELQNFCDASCSGD